MKRQAESGVGHGTLLARVVQHAPRLDIHWLVEIFALAALYFLTARLGLLMAIPGGHVTPVWPPSGIALAAVLLRGRRIWPGIWLGSFAANVLDFYGSPSSLATGPAMSATFGIGASLTAVLGGQLLRRFVGERNPLERVRDVCAFMALGGVVSCLSSATIGVTALCLAGFAPWSAYGQTWLTWWLADSAGVFIVAPLFLVWGGTRRWKSAARWVELFVGFGLLIAVTHYVFIENTIVPFAGGSLPFALVPFLIWSAVRFGRRGAAMAVGLIALLAVWGTIHGSGPFNLGSRHESLLALELFLSVVSLTALCLAAVAMAQRHAEDNRRRMFDELESRVAERTKSLHQANAALRQLAQVSAASSDYVALIGRDFRYQFVNDTYLKARGLHLQGIVGHHMREIVGQERFEKLGRPQVEACLRGEEVESFEWTDFRPDLRCFLHVKVAPLREPDGTISGAVMSGRDITARYGAERALRESEERFRSYFELGLIGAAITSPTKGWIEVNDEICRMLGYERSQLLLMTWAELTHPDDLAADVAHFNRVLAGEIDGYAIDKRFTRKDGRVIDVTISVKCLRGADGSVDYFVALLQDITERKKAQQALAEQAIRYKTLMETSADSIYILDEQGDLKEANAAFLSRRGYTAAEATTLHVADWDAQWTRTQLQERLRTWVDGGSVFETQHRCKDGSIFDVESCVTRVRIAGQVLFFCVARDITERARFRQIAENISEVFWIWTATPGEARLLYVSPAYEAVWGRSCESLYASPNSWKEALHHHDKERVLAEIANLDVETMDELTYRIVRPDQSIRWIRDRIFPVRDVTGVVVRLAGIAEDITKSKEAEEEIRKANRQLRNLARLRIQEQEDERRKLSRELHDQIGQSLTAAKINVEALRPTTSPALVGRLEETAAILDQLLGQVRQISLDLRPPMLDDLGLVPALRSFIDEQGRRASVAVRFSAEHIPEKLDPEIQITCFRIAQEAITNAVRHAKATQLDIALRCARGKHLRLLARDNGIGFDAQATQAQAVDLGLIGIKERAALVGGRAKIISSPREGTTIDVSLPLAFRPERQARHT
jgi:PAS domain S-box-containing protein